MGGKADAAFRRRRRLRRRPGLRSRLWWSGLGGLRLRRRRRRWPRSFSRRRMGGLWRRCGGLLGGLWRRRRRPRHFSGRLNHGLGELWGRSRFRRWRLRRLCLNRFNSRLSRSSLFRRTGRRLGKGLARRRLRSRLRTRRTYMGSQAHACLLGRRAALRNGSGLCGGRLRLWRRCGGLWRGFHRLLGRLRLWRGPGRRGWPWLRGGWPERRAPPNELPRYFLNLWRRRRMRWWGLSSRSGPAHDDFRPRGLRPHHLPGRLNHGLRGRRRGGRPRAGDFPRDLPNGGAGRPGRRGGWPGRRLWK